MNVGVNFFGVKKKLYQDFEGTIKRLKESGFTSVEPCVAFGEAHKPPKN